MMPAAIRERERRERQKTQETPAQMEARLQAEGGQVAELRLYKPD